MKMHISGDIAYLVKDWTFTGVTSSNIDSLAASLEQIGSGSAKNLQVDCGQIREIDAEGLQLLYTWLQCLKIRGVKPKLVNLPEKLQKTFQVKGLQNYCLC